MFSQLTEHNQSQFPLCDMQAVTTTPLSLSTNIQNPSPNTDLQLPLVQDTNRQRLISFTNNHPKPSQQTQVTFCLSRDTSSEILSRTLQKHMHARTHSHACSIPHTEIYFQARIIIAHFLLTPENFRWDLWSLFCLF